MTDEHPLPLGLTALQRDALRVIAELTALSRGVPPSFEELARELDIAGKSGVSRLVAALEARGCLARRIACARSLAVLVAVAPLEEPEFAGLFDDPGLAAAARPAKPRAREAREPGGP